VTSRHLRSLALWAIPAVVIAVIAVGCVPTGERPSFADEYISSTLPPGGSLLPSGACPPTQAPFEMFTATEVRVITPSGEPLPRCVLVADSFALRSQGLMNVTDLAVYDGMIFAFAEPTEGSFWMGNTHIPLTIAFIDPMGHVVSTADMEPCPEAIDCPSYSPEGPYLWALEVRQGALGGFGLTEGGSFDPTSLPLGLE
jgi:uncharacterized protein